MRLSYVMQTKLTLRMDSDLIEGAKKVAGHRNTSLSRMVADYFNALLSNDPAADSGGPLPPKTKSLMGVLRDDSKPVPNESDHADFLERKYS